MTFCHYLQVILLLSRLFTWKFSLPSEQPWESFGTSSQRQSYVPSTVRLQYERSRGNMMSYHQVKWGTIGNYGNRIGLSCCDCAHMSPAVQDSLYPSRDVIMTFYKFVECHWHSAPFKGSAEWNAVWNSRWNINHICHQTFNVDDNTLTIGGPIFAGQSILMSLLRYNKKQWPWRRKGTILAACGATASYISMTVVSSYRPHVSSTSNQIQPVTSLWGSLLPSTCLQYAAIFFHFVKHLFLSI